MVALGLGPLGQGSGSLGPIGFLKLRYGCVSVVWTSNGSGVGLEDGLRRGLCWIS